MLRSRSTEVRRKRLNEDRVRLLEPLSAMQVAAGSSPVAPAKRSDHSLKGGTTFIGADQPVSFGQDVNQAERISHIAPRKVRLVLDNFTALLQESLLRLCNIVNRHFQDWT
jgi:hypothetical protein